MGNLELALSAYENALRHNPMSLSGLTQVAGIARIKENYPKVRSRTLSRRQCIGLSSAHPLTLSARATGPFSLDRSARSHASSLSRQSSISNVSSTCSRTTARSGVP